MYKELEIICWNEEYIKQTDKFSIQQLYKSLRGEYHKVDLRRLIRNNVARQKWIFILYLALQKRLLTRPQGIDQPHGDVYKIYRALCKESHNHLFFRCVFAAQVLQKVLEREA